MDLIKNIFLKFIFLFGFFQFFHFISRNKITILYLHSIIDDEDPAPTLWRPLRSYHNSQQLTKTLEILEKKYQFISLSTAIKILKKEIAPIKNALVITLDDGYLNNIKVGGPIFAKLAIKPTIFISTSHTENNTPFWFDRLDYALQQIKDTSYTTSIEGDDFIFDCKTRESLKYSYALFRRKIKKQFKSDISLRSYTSELSKKIEDYTGRSLNDINSCDVYSQLATWAQLKDAQLNLHFEIGSHTVNHARLALVDNASLKKELTESKQEVEKKLTMQCTTFCYPDNSYNKNTILKTKEYYDCALTTDIGLNSVGDDLVRLKRFNLPINPNPLKTLYAISALRSFITKRYK